MTDHPSPTGVRRIDRYCDELLLALRMKDVPGPRIGSVLAEVRAHLVDSGEEPEAAFGPPEEYAAALAAPAPPRSRAARLHEARSGAACLLGVVWLLEGAVSLATGTDARLGPIPLGAAVLAGAGAPWLLEQLVSRSRGRMALGLAVFVVAGAAWGGLDLLVDDAVGLTVHPAVAAGLGLSTLVAGTLAIDRTIDVVVMPFDSPADVDAKRRRSGILLTALLWTPLLLLMAVVVVMAVLLGSAG